jgi:hypothetical protein
LLPVAHEIKVHSMRETIFLLCDFVTTDILLPNLLYYFILSLIV